MLTFKSYCINSSEHSHSLEYIFLEKHQDFYVYAHMFVCIHTRSHIYTLFLKFFLHVAMFVFPSIPEGTSDFLPQTIISELPFG